MDINDDNTLELLGNENYSDFIEYKEKNEE